jgi:hypothetical protein
MQKRIHEAHPLDNLLFSAALLAVYHLDLPPARPFAVNDCQVEAKHGTEVITR